MQDNSFFSVIIPTFNRAHTLKRALDSIYKQSFKDFEVIVVDDGSTDQTQTILADYHDIKIIKQENLGVSSARNIGAKEAKGKWLAFLDSDDEWLEDKLKRQFDFIKKNPDLSIVHGEEIWIRKGKRVNPKVKHQKGGGDQFFRSLELCVISPSAVCLTQELFQEMNGFNPEFTVCEDYDLWLKITSKYLIGYLKDPLIIKYGGHDDQLSQKYKAMDYYRIKSIANLVKMGELSQAQKEEALMVFKRKWAILHQGYLKHGHQDKVQEIEKLKRQLF